MKAFIVLAVIVAAGTDAGVVVSSGTSTSQRSEHEPKNYVLDHDAKQSSAGSVRSDSGSRGVMVGSYGLNGLDNDGLAVSYAEDKAINRPSVATEERGAATYQSAAATYTAAAPKSAASGAALHRLLSIDSAIYTSRALSFARPAAIAAPIVAPIVASISKIAMPVVYATGVPAW